MKNLMVGLSIVILYGGLCGSTLYACELCSSPEACDMESTMGTKPAGCSLSPSEFSDRKSEVGLVLARRQEVRKLDDGYALQFPGDDADLASSLTTWVVAERQCCSFVQFELTFAPEQGPIWLSVRGSQEFVAMLSSVLQTPATTGGQ